MAALTLCVAAAGHVRRRAVKAIVTINKTKAICAACAVLLLASPAIAQGGFGVTLGSQNLGPRYPGDEERDAGGCVWRRQWVVDKQGRRILRRVRICY